MSVFLCIMTFFALDHLPGPSWPWWRQASHVVLVLGLATLAVYTWTVAP